MAGELKRFLHGTTTTLEASGAQIVDAAIAQANDASLDLGGYTSPADYPHAVFIFTGTMGTTPTAMRVLELIARRLDVDGTTDTPAPTASYRERLIGAFVLEPSTSSQTLVCEVRHCPRKMDAYIYNASGVTLNSGWSLKVTPFSLGPV